MASKLIIAGSHVGATSRSGLTPAHLAARRGHAAVLERLLGAGYVANTVDDTHRTALLTCLVKCSMDMLGMDILHTVCVCVFMRVYSEAPMWLRHSHLPTGCTALHLAAAYGHTAAVQVLLDAGADRCAADAHGRTPIHLAAAAGGDVAAALWVPDTPLPPPTPAAEGVLHFACHGGDVAVVQWLLDVQGLDVNQVTANGRTPLFYAARGATASELCDGVAVLSRPVVTAKYTIPCDDGGDELGIVMHAPVWTSVTTHPQLATRGS